MKLSIEFLRRIFDDVLSGCMSREAADRWAYSVIQQSEADNLVIIPAENKERVWAGVMYLYGMDVLSAPNEYLHTIEDIRSALQIKLGGG
ncbi:hypothetical protein [Mitsuaria sp. 7]|uniref:hypothetical protein n=1 Tax=Mitsuaria sp. 7 TaxID=1658665 RepID=UPI0012F7776E|nr:hypothetical protein [Mitsuaria sp. 7]